MPILPEVLVLWPPRHRGARCVAALLAYCAVDEVDAVEEVDDVDGQPVAEVLAGGKADGLETKNNEISLSHTVVRPFEAIITVLSDNLIDGIFS